MKKYLRQFILMTIIFYSCSSTKMNRVNKKQKRLFLATLESTDVGKVSFYIDYKENNNNFEMLTQKNSDIKLFGFFKAIGGRMFMNTMRKGSLVNINGIVKNDSLIGKLKSPLGYFGFVSIRNNDSIIGELIYKNEKVGTFNSILSKNKVTIRDYKELVNKVIKTTKLNIYNPNLVKTRKWNKFEKQLKRKSSYFRDDLELITYFFYKSRQLPFSHFNILNKDYSSSKNTGKILSTRLSDETVILKIQSFNNNKETLKDAITAIIAGNYKNLIIDLRNNYGGNIESALTLVSHIIDKPLHGGYFITQKWHRKNNNKIPNKLNTRSFPVFSEANYNLLMQGIHKHEGLILQVNPTNMYFKGKVFVLTNKSTASTCEPIIYGLKINNRAIIVGEKTSGAMLSAEPFELFDGFKLFLPTADYFTSDGKRLDKIGVIPNIKIESKNSLEYVLNNLIK